MGKGSGRRPSSLTPSEMEDRWKMAFKKDPFDKEGKMSTYNRGASAIKEQNLKWYTNGKQNRFVSEGSEPEGYYRGRTMGKSLSLNKKKQEV